ncbi:MAG: L-asparaginase [Clostridiales bacterium]|nr:L-asparaginase [Clostridiales bacterium]MDN5299783.1 L-asparaginase [Clostridiales bacterium]
MAIIKDNAGPKPHITILATGGTIASRGGNSLSLTDYGVSTGRQPVGIDTLMEAVPEMHQFAEISGEQLFNVGSSKLSIENLLTLAKRINVQLSLETIDGVVVTHGTDTLEETAYFLNLVVKSDKPVVLVASMRPATGLSADGPINLVNAIALASNPLARNKGVMVCMNDQISSAFGVAKTNTTNVAAFKCPDTGYLGIMQNFEPFFMSAPVKRHTHQTEFDVANLATLPRVDIVYTALGTDGLFIDAAVAAGAKGIINSGLGHGNMSAAAMASLEAARKKGVTVVVGSRTGSGLVTPTQQFDKRDFVTAMMHSAPKSRILLMLALTVTDEPSEIQRLFDQY